MICWDESALCLPKLKAVSMITWQGALTQLCKVNSTSATLKKVISMSRYHFGVPQYRQPQKHIFIDWLESRVSPSLILKIRSQQIRQQVSVLFGVPDLYLKDHVGNSMCLDLYMESNLGLCISVLMEVRNS